MTADQGIDRLAAQVAFVLEVDRLKSVLRRGYTADGSRREVRARLADAVARGWIEPGPAGGDDTTP